MVVFTLKINSSGFSHYLCDLAHMAHGLDLADMAKIGQCVWEVWHPPHDISST